MATDLMSVTYIHNAMRGAPVLNGQPGSLIALLDAFLITGFGVVTATSVTVGGGIATATLPSGQSFDAYAIVQVAGATPAALNGRARVLTSSNTSITWATTAPDGPATGTITIRVAPVGQWEKRYSAANKAVYRSTDPQSYGHCLRVDDSGATFARIVAYESMTDVDTGSGPFPTAAMAAGGGYIHKSTSANSNAVRYAMAGDSRAFLWAIEPGTAGSTTPRNSNVRGFGDPIPLAPGGDAWSGFLSCITASGTSFTESGSLSGQVSSASYGVCVTARATTGLGGAVLHNAAAYTGVPTGYSGNDASLGAAPSSVDGRIYLSRLHLRPSAGTEGPRAIVPGVLYVPQSGLVSLVNPHDVMDGAGDWLGRRLLAVGVGASASAAPTGIAFLDITGPWR